MKVTIVITVYNVELYIEKCLLSVYNQTYDNIEFIIVDDRGSDNSMDVARRVSEPYLKSRDIRFIEHTQNRGLSAARNTGIDAATGEYIYFIDSDDFITENCIELMVGYATKYPSVDMVVGDHYKYDNGVLHPSQYGDFFANKKFETDRITLKRIIIGDGTLPVESWNKLMRKEFLIANNLRFKEGIYFEDYHLCFHIAKCVTSICTSPEKSYFYVQRNASIMNIADKNKSKFLDSRLFIYTDFIANIDSPCQREQKEFIFRGLMQSYILIGDTEYRKSFAGIVKSFPQKCNWFGKLVLSTILHTPRFILKKRVVYQTLLKLSSYF